MVQPPGFVIRPEQVPRGNPGKLTKAEEYRAVLASEYRWAGKCFLMRVLPNVYMAARLGLITSRKAAPRAVDRNRGKRLIREAFRTARPQLPAVDIVFQQKNDLRNNGNLDLRKELDRLLREMVHRFGDGRSASTTSNLSLKTA